VEDGVTGYRIPTLMGGNGNPIATRYQMGGDDYNGYSRSTSQGIAMDIGAAADAWIIGWRKMRICAGKWRNSARLRARRV
jgi:hypothetical protein